MGKDLANPIGLILSASMLLSYALGLYEESKSVEKAVNQAIRDGYTTKDIFAAGKILTDGCPSTDFESIDSFGRYSKLM